MTAFFSEYSLNGSISEGHTRFMSTTLLVSPILTHPSVRQHHEMDAGFESCTAVNLSWVAHPKLDVGAAGLRKLDTGPGA